jgi:hypothetical protein
MSTTDFWGVLPVEPLRTPLTIMREQAALLGRRTNGVLEAEVQTSVDEQEFIHSFDLVVPSLQFYRYTLFRVRHGAMIYPVRAGVGDLQNETAFTNWLKTILTSGKTQKIIANLLSQAKA